MQLDYRQFVVKLDKMTEQRPVPYQVAWKKRRVSSMY